MDSKTYNEIDRIARDLVRARDGKHFQAGGAQTPPPKYRHWFHGHEVSWSWQQYNTYDDVKDYMELIQDKKLIDEIIDIAAPVWYHFLSGQCNSDALQTIDREDIDGNVTWSDEIDWQDMEKHGYPAFYGWSKVLGIWAMYADPTEVSRVLSLADKQWLIIERPFRHPEGEFVVDALSGYRDIHLRKVKADNRSGYAWALAANTYEKDETGRWKYDMISIKDLNLENLNSYIGYDVDGRYANLMNAMIMSEHQVVREYLQAVLQRLDIAKKMEYPDGP